MSNNMKAWALAYAKLGWPVFPVTGYKTPFKNSHGHLDATTDQAVVEAWWTARPAANLALACGDIVVFDADGPTAVARLKAILAAHNWVPDTAMAATSRGFHLYFRAPADVHVRTRNEPRSKSGDDGIDIKAHGGWVVLPPSVSAKSRFQYKWLSPLPIAEMPMWLLEALAPPDLPLEAHFKHLGEVPDHLKRLQTHDVTSSIESNLRTEYSEAEHARLVSALTAIPISCCYDDFLKIGMALKKLEWERSDGTSISFDIWNGWCAQSEHHNEAGLESKWNSFRRSGVTVASIYHMAQQHGWAGGAPSLLGTGHVAPPLASPVVGQGQPTQLNGHTGPVQVLPAAFLRPPSGAIFFPDRTEEGHPKATYTNAIVAVEALGIACEHDLFHNRMLVAGEPLAQWNNIELTDNIVMVIRSLIRHRYGFDPNKQNTSDACQFLCLKNQFDPVLDYLDDLQWDATPRLDTWLVRYLGAADTDFNRAVSRLSLIAAVRRARYPGTKFDQIVVLEGPEEGKGKSSAVRILAGPENFSDQKILGVDDRMQQELLEGVWLYEISELSGMNKAEVEHVKAFASRDEDRARPAYGRFRVNVKRRTIFFASTNRSDYLISDTGNRRFWPVLTGHIDLIGLQRDRDQLWAEAAQREARGESHLLPEKLWNAAGEQQTSRMAADVWSEAIINYLNLKNATDVSIIDVLCDNQFLQLRPSELGQREQNRAASILRSLDFLRYQKRLPDGKRVWRYRKSDVRQTGPQE